MKSVPQKVDLVDSMGSDLSVVDAARVSFNKQSEYEEFTYDDIVEGEHRQFTKYNLSEKDQKLLAYLAKHNHWSPFAHTSLQFRIKAPIFVARQLVKHQVGGVWNEVSRRYVDEEPEFFFPDVWRGKPVNAKQGSSEDTVEDDFFAAVYTELPLFTKDVVAACLDLYGDMINKGVAPEQARMILPQNMMTEWIWTGSLYFFARVCNLRLDPHAQAETREIAQKINDLIPEKFKYSWQSLVH